jgi:hypothetical protein
MPSPMTPCAKCWQKPNWPVLPLLPASICAMLDFMRDPQIIDTELMEISAITDDVVKLERIIAWCASHPDEVPFALHQFMGRRENRPSKSSET